MSSRGEGAPPSLRRLLLGALAALLVAAALLAVLQRRVSGAFLPLGGDPEVIALLEASRDDQRALARRDPVAAAAHRARFEALDTLLRRLRVLGHSREDIVRRYRFLLLAASTLAVAVLLGGLSLRQRRRERRLARLRRALGALADGRTDLDLGPPRRDLIGRVAAMVERASRAMARDRRRLAALRNLSAWQEAARRHAHEMRTPLTGARLELARLEDLAPAAPPAQAEEIRDAAHSVAQELERLGRFTQAFTSFARLPRPRPEPCDLRRAVEAFAATFADAWPGMALELDSEPAHGAFPVRIDRDLLRQVLVNLCDNAHLALAGRPGRLRLVVRALDAGREGGLVALDVADDGPGVDPAVRERLFEPYTTTRGIGAGMGLGLAIAKKLMLDSDGDLELLASSPAGATFRLTLPCHPDAAHGAREDDTT